jgi:Holliday junction resolvase-like predicted endonuclease
MSRRAKGMEGENLIAQFPEEMRYAILERNCRFDRRKIDLSAKRGQEWVLFEAKAQHSQQYGSLEESVTPAKGAQLKKVVQGYLYEHNIENQSCRFDVVMITYHDDVPVVRLIQNAFLA